MLGVKERWVRLTRGGHGVVGSAEAGRQQKLQAVKVKEEDEALSGSWRKPPTRGKLSCVSADAGQQQKLQAVEVKEEDEAVSE